MIVGAGPVGVTAANLLGIHGVTALVIDRETEIVDYPRAIGVDDETLRTFQAIGLVDDVLRGAIQNVPLKFFDAAGHCLADIRPTTRDNGWYQRNIFLQPLAEAVLRRGLDRFPHVRLLLGIELRDITQDGDGATLCVADKHGRQRRVRADYVIAADAAVARYATDWASPSTVRRTRANGWSSTAPTIPSTLPTPRCTATRVAPTSARTCRTTTAAGSSCCSPARTPSGCSPRIGSRTCSATTFPTRASST